MRGSQLRSFLRTGLIVKQWLCSSTGLHIISFDRALESRSGQLFSMVWGTRESVVSWGEPIRRRLVLLRRAAIFDPISGYEDRRWVFSIFGVEERRWGEGSSIFGVEDRRSKIEDGGVLRSSGFEDRRWGVL